MDDYILQWVIQCTFGPKMFICAGMEPCYSKKYGRKLPLSQGIDAGGLGASSKCQSLCELWHLLSLLYKYDGIS